MTPPTALFPRTKSLRCARLEKAEDELVAKIVERRLRDEDPDAWDDGDFDAFRAELGI